MARVGKPNDFFFANVEVAGLGQLSGGGFRGQGLTGDLNESGDP